MPVHELSGSDEKFSFEPSGCRLVNSQKKGGCGSIASAFLRECLSRREEPVPEEDFVTAEGENGHIIHVLKKRDYAARAGELDIRWNCSDPARAPEAFVRHYTNFLRLARDGQLDGDAKPSVIA